MAWLAGWCAPAFAQDTSPVHATLQTVCDVREPQPDNSPPAEGESSAPEHLCGTIPVSIQSAVVLLAPVVLPSAPAFAQTSANPPDEKRSEQERSISYGVEVEFGSGHADRGFVVSDSPVVQPVAWVSGRFAELSVWSNITLAETTEDSRPQIVELELTRTREWRNFTIAPAVRMHYYRDVLSVYSSRSIEGWLSLSYRAGRFRLFSNQSVDLLAYKGGYFGDAGVAIDRHVSPTVKAGSSFKAGWASPTFNDFWAEVDKSAFNLIGVEGWLTVYVNRHTYIKPYFEFSTIVDRAVRAGSARPTLFFVGLTTGVEF
jgi:hypothetical protein